MVVCKKNRCALRL